MQYILTEQEYRNLVSKSRYESKCEEAEKLSELVLKFANYICIHDRTWEEMEDEEFFCDNCPLFKADLCHKSHNLSQ